MFDFLVNAEAALRLPDMGCVLLPELCCLLQH